MYRYFFVLIFLWSSLVARENPFFPTQEEEIPLTTNQFQKDIPLKRASVKLPSTARTVESVTVNYKNMDGSIAQKTIELQNSIDWHLPLFITQNYQTQQQQTSIIEKQKTKVFKEIAKLPFIKFKIFKSEIVLETKDKMLRSFLLVKPHRIVCDFKRETNIRSYVKKIKNQNVTLIKVGTHKGYYRVVIELDGSYRYSKKQTNDGYTFNLR